MSRSKSRRRRPRKKKSNTKKIVLIVALAAVAVIIVAYNMLGNNDGSSENGSTQNVTSTQMKVLLETSMGDITIQLRDDMPITTENFKNLVQQGVYDGTIFHRVVNLPNNLVMIQGGDPTGTGYGDPSIPSIQDEFSENPENNKNERGTIAMANKGEDYPNSGSSQFFINGAYNSHLDNLHPIFGEVIDGLNVVDDILDVETSGEPSNKPLEDVTLIRAQLVD
jgi:peptidylprolyl isomerase